MSAKAGIRLLSLEDRTADKWRQEKIFGQCIAVMTGPTCKSGAVCGLRSKCRYFVAGKDRSENMVC
jgi:hypothetical protein